VLFALGLFQFRMTAVLNETTPNTEMIFFSDLDY